MFCKNCGAELKTGVAFCTVCGAPAKQPKVGSAAVTPPSEHRLADLSRAKQRSGRRKVLSVVAVVVVIFLALVVYGSFVTVPPGASSSTSGSQTSSQSGILAGSYFYNGTSQTPTAQTLNAGGGAQGSFYSVPGQVVMAGSSSATLASVQGVVSRYGGVLLSYAPSAGFYVASSGSVNESAFIEDLNSSGLFINVGPDMAATRASAIGPPILLDTQLFAKDALRARMAGVQSEVVMVIVDNFASPGAHGFRVAGALDAAYPQPYIEVEDTASNGVVTSSAAIRALLTVIDAAQAENKKVVINWSSFGSCGYPVSCSLSDEHYNWRVLERELLFALDAIDLAGQNSWVHQGNVVLTQASGNSGLDISSDLQALNNNPQVNSVLRNNLELCGLLSLGGQSIWPMSNHGSSTANLGPNYYQVGVDYVPPPGANYASGTSFAAPVCASYAYTTWNDNPQYTSAEVIQSLHGSESVLPVGAHVLNPPTNGTTVPPPVTNSTTTTAQKTGTWTISLQFSLTGTLSLTTDNYYYEQVTYKYSGGGVFTFNNAVAGNVVPTLHVQSFASQLQILGYPTGSCPPDVVGCPDGGTPPSSCDGTGAGMVPSYYSSQPSALVITGLNPDGSTELDNAQLSFIDARSAVPSITLVCTNGTSVDSMSVGDLGVQQFFLSYYMPVNIVLSPGKSTTISAPFGTPLGFDLTYWDYPFDTLSGTVSISVVSGPS